MTTNVLSKEFQRNESINCDCSRRGNHPTLAHDSTCKFHRMMIDPRTHYHNFKVIQDELTFLDTELTKVKVEVTDMRKELRTGLAEVKAMLGDFLALFRASTGTAGG